MFFIVSSHDFFGNNLDEEMSKCHEEREKYQNYFDGLHKLADMRDMIEDINNGLAELDKHVQTNINDMTKRQGTYLFFNPNWFDPEDPNYDNSGKKNHRACFIFLPCFHPHSIHSYLH